MGSRIPPVRLGRRLGRRLAALASLVEFLVVPHASWADAGSEIEIAQDTEPDTHESLPRLYVVLRGGLAAYGFTQSFTPAHALDPMVRLEVGALVTERLELGVEFATVPSSNDNYRLLGGSVVGRAAAHLGSWYEFWFGWSVGAGSAPRIGYRDLIVRQDVALWVGASLQNRFRLLDSLALGFDLGVDNLSVIHVLAAVHVRL